MRPDKVAEFAVLTGRLGNANKNYLLVLYNIVAVLALLIINKVLL